MVLVFGVGVFFLEDSGFPDGRKPSERIWQVIAYLVFELFCKCPDFVVAGREVFVERVWGARGSNFVSGRDKLSFV